MGNKVGLPNSCRPHLGWWLQRMAGEAKLRIQSPGKDWPNKRNFLRLNWLTSKMLVLAPRAQATLSVSVDGALHLPVLLIPLLFLASK